jgi:enoyl-CoA hydratase
MEMIMTAGMSGSDAYRTGLVNHVVPEVNFLLYKSNNKIIKFSIITGKAIKAVNANFKEGKTGMGNQRN